MRRNCLSRGSISKMIKHINLYFYVFILEKYNFVVPCWFVYYVRELELLIPIESNKKTLFSIA